MPSEVSETQSWDYKASNNKDDIKECSQFGSGLADSESVGARDPSVRTNLRW